MALKIEPVHLQFARSLMHPLPNVTEAFFASPPPATVMLFRHYDNVARFNAALRAKNVNIEPSCFFETIIEFSGHILNEMLQAITQKMAPDAVEAIKDKGANLSFNFYTFYILPLFAANHFISPYLPDSRIDAFFKEIESRNPREKTAYLGSVLEFINNQGMSWIEPYKLLAGRLNMDGAHTILLMIGLFKEACGESQNLLGPPQTPHAGEEGQHTALPPDIEKFLKDLLG